MSNTYFVSFTLDDGEHGRRSYSTRWQDLYDAIRGLSDTYWEQTAAFIAFKTTADISQIVSAVRGAISPEYDIVLIRSMDSKIARILGPVTDPDIFAIMPYLKKA